MDVRPAPGELLSSWLNRLAHANGVPPRYFGAVLGVAGETWSAQLDRHLPDAVRRLLLDHTSICPDEIVAQILGLGLEAAVPVKTSESNSTNTSTV